MNKYGMPGLKVIVLSLAFFLATMLCTHSALYLLKQIAFNTLSIQDFFGGTYILITPKIDYNSRVTLKNLTFDEVFFLPFF